MAEKKEVTKVEAVKKENVKKSTARKTKLNTSLAIQFSGKTYTDEKLIKIAKDVWKYDLGQKEADLTSIEIYVKPEESAAYYVMNNQFTGSFYI